MAAEEQFNPWKIIDQQVVYDNQWISLSHYNVITPGGGKGIYGKVHFKNIGIGIVAVDEQMDTYLVGQYRFPTEQYSWEVPEGGCPLGEDPLAAAQRELLEETGLKAAHWQLIGQAHLSNSVTDEYSLFYLATGLTQHEAEPEETEQLALRKVPLQQAFDMIDNGEITDGLAILTLQRLQVLLLQGKLDLSRR